jgi:hypothetical protein
VNIFDDLYDGRTVDVLMIFMTEGTGCFDDFYDGTGCFDGL